MMMFQVTDRCGRPSSDVGSSSSRVIDPSSSSMCWRRRRGGGTVRHGVFSLS